MRAVVKEFIEATITDLEAQNYYNMFTIWYNHFVEGNQSKDRDNLDELFKVFSSAGVELYLASEDARKTIIAEHMYEYMDDVLTYDTTVVTISFDEVIKHINSRLSLSLITLRDIFNDVCMKLATTHDIVKQPFRVRRIKK